MATITYTNASAIFHRPGFGSYEKVGPEGRAADPSIRFTIPVILDGAAAAFGDLLSELNGVERSQWEVSHLRQTTAPGAAAGSPTSHSMWLENEGGGFIELIGTLTPVLSGTAATNKFTFTARVVAPPFVDPENGGYAFALAPTSQLVISLDQLDPTRIYSTEDYVNTGNSALTTAGASPFGAVVSGISIPSALTFNKILFGLGEDAQGELSSLDGSFTYAVPVSGGGKINYTGTNPTSATLAEVTLNPGSGPITVGTVLDVNGTLLRVTAVGTAAAAGTFTVQAARGGVIEVVAGTAVNFQDVDRLHGSATGLTFLQVGETDGVVRKDVAQIFSNASADKPGVSVDSTLQTPEQWDSVTKTAGLPVPPPTDTSSLPPDLNLIPRDASFAIVSSELATTGRFSFDSTKLEAVLPALTTNLSAGVTITNGRLPITTSLSAIDPVFLQSNDTIDATKDTSGAVLNGGGGNDTINAGSGDDIIYGGSGDNILNGGAGADTFVVNTGHGGDRFDQTTNTVTMTQVVNTAAAAPIANVGTVLANLPTFQLNRTTINGGAGLDTLRFEDGRPEGLELITPFNKYQNPEEQTIKIGAVATTAASSTGTGAVITVTLPASGALGLVNAGQPIRIAISASDFPTPDSGTTAAALAANAAARGAFVANKVQEQLDEFLGDHAEAYLDPLDPTMVRVRFDVDLGNVPAITVTAAPLTGTASPFPITVQQDLLPLHASPMIVELTLAAFPTTPATGQPLSSFVFGANASGASSLGEGTITNNAQLADAIVASFNQNQASGAFTQKAYRVEGTDKIRFQFSGDGQASPNTVYLARSNAPNTAIGTQTQLTRYVDPSAVPELDGVIKLGSGAEARIGEIKVVNGVWGFHSILAPADGEIGLLYKSSWRGEGSGVPNEYVVLKDVEQIQVGEQVFGSQSMYLGSMGNDTLYSWNWSDRQAFEEFPEDPQWTNLMYPRLGPTNVNGRDLSFQYLNGGEGNDRLIGRDAFLLGNLADEGRDYLVGADKSGTDTLIGGTGSDVYVVDSRDQIIESELVDSWIPGDDPRWLANLDIAFVTGTFTVAPGAGIERMQVHQIRLAGTPFDPGLVNNWSSVAPVAASQRVDLTGSNSTYEYIGHDGDNTITAASRSGLIGLGSQAGGALMLGFGGADSLIGGEGADRLFGGQGNDTLSGGAGNDYLFMGFDDSLKWAQNGQRLPELYNYYVEGDQQKSSPRFTTPWDFPADFEGNGSLTGGNDVGSGGEGIDTLVVGYGGGGELDPSLAVDRSSATEIRFNSIYGETMRIDASVELVRFAGMDDEYQLTYAVPWVIQDERQRWAYEANLEAVAGDSYAGWLYVGPSAFNDLIDLRAATGATGSWLANGRTQADSLDAQAGDDIIYAGLPVVDGVLPNPDTPQFNRINGGDGNDQIYVDGFRYGVSTDPNRSPLEQWQMALLGGAGNDTFTVNFAGFQPGPDFPVEGRLESSWQPQLLMDGGAGDDTYRMLLPLNEGGQEFNWNRQARFEITDSGGINDTLVLQLDENYELAYDNARGRFVQMSGFGEEWNSESETPLTQLEPLEIGSFAVNTIERVVLSDDSRFFAPTISFALYNPKAADFGPAGNARFTGTAGNDAILASLGVRAAAVDGGAGDDFIQIAAYDGTVVTGGLGNNIIEDINIPWADRGAVTLSYATFAAGSLTVDLRGGYAFGIDATDKLVLSDRFGDNMVYNVIGGGSNDVIIGNGNRNRLDGGAGNDLIYAGRGYTDTGAGYIYPITMTSDWLIGGAGDDTLVNDWESVSTFNDMAENGGQPASEKRGALLDGGAGNDTYVLSGEHWFGGMSGQRFLPTRIVERTAAGVDATGSDTIKITDGDPSLASPLSYAQTGNRLTVRLPSAVSDPQVQVGDMVLLDFLTTNGSPTPVPLDGSYRVSALVREGGAGPVLGFEVALATAAALPLAGTVAMAQSNIGTGAAGYWLNQDQFVITNNERGNYVEGNQGNTTSRHVWDDGGGFLSSDAEVMAIVDRFALDNIEFGGSDRSPGAKFKISLNQGAQAAPEVILAGSNLSLALYGGQGTDIIYGNAGYGTPNLLIGGDGNDWLVSFGAEGDVLLGGAGDDVLMADSGEVFMLGGAGADTFVIAGGGDYVSLVDFNPYEGDVVRFDQEWLDDIADLGGSHELSATAGLPSLNFNDGALLNGYFMAGDQEALIDIARTQLQKQLDDFFGVA
ncbi:RTX calcium-binding nonapeptide repeat [Oxalobacteraceae bacterium]